MENDTVRRSAADSAPQPEMNDAQQQQLASPQPSPSTTTIAPPTPQGSSGIGSRRGQIQRKVRPRLEAYKAALIATGRKVPAHPCYPNEPYFSRIGEEMSARPEQLSDRKLPHRQFIFDMADEIGLEVVFPETRKGPLTLEELKIAASSQYERELEAEGKTKEQTKAAVANLRRAVNNAIAIGGEGGDTPAEDGLAAAIAAATATSNEHVDRKLVSDLKRSAAILTAIQIGDGLPADFVDALVLASMRTGLKWSVIARNAGINVNTFLNWKDRRNTPRQQDLAKIERLEKFLGLPDGALKSRLRFTDRHNLMPTGLAAPVVDGDRRIDPTMTEEQAKARTLIRIEDFLRDEELRTIWRRGGPGFGADWPLPRDINGKRFYDEESNWPEPLRRDRDAYLSFRSDPIAPYGMNRPDEPLSEAAQTIYDQRLGFLMGFCCSAENLAFRIPKDLLTLGELVFPRIVHEAFKWRTERHCVRHGMAVVSGFDLGYFHQARSMLAEDVGWLTQSPELAEKLVAVPSLDPKEEWIVSPDDVARAKADWPAACREAFKGYSERVDSHKKLVKTSQDRLTRIEPILELADPLVAFRLGTAGLNAELAMLNPKSAAYANALRDRIIWGIESQVALRVKNLPLTYREDNRGQLRLLHGIWWVCIPRQNFKNKNGPFFKWPDRSLHDYVRPLKDIGGLYQALELYVTVYRPKLLAGKKTNALFVSMRGGLGKLALTRSIKRTFKKYVMHNPATGTGIPGVLPTGVHWVRAVLATGVLKRSRGRVDLAAAAIHDSEDTVRKSYLRYRPSDIVEMLLEALGDG